MNEISAFLSASLGSFSFTWLKSIDNDESKYNESFISARLPSPIVNEICQYINPSFVFFHPILF